MEWKAICRDAGIHGVANDSPQLDAYYRKKSLNKSTDARYRIECDKCHKVTYRKKASSIIQEPKKYKCRCGGKLIIQKV